MSLLQNSNAISAGGYDLSNSLRFRSSASTRLSRTFASSSGTTNTWSFWIKRGTLGVAQHIFSWTNLSTTSMQLVFDAGDTFTFANVASSAVNAALTTTQVFRDPSAWYHIVFVLDTTQATAANRLKLYVNGVQVTAFGTATYPAQNTAMAISTSAAWAIGARGGANDIFFDGYMDEYNFIDGQALTPSSFGETDPVTGSWAAKKYTGTYGTNGFYLPFINNNTNENLLTYSEQFDNAAWTKVNSGSGSLPVVTANAGAAPNGTTTADKVVFATVGGSDISQIAQITSFNPGSTYTGAIWVKAFAAGDVGKILGFRHVSGGNYTLVTLTNAWQQVTSAEVAYGGSVTFELISRPSVGTSSGTISCYVWGAQLNYGSSLETYIATTASALTPTGTMQNWFTYSEQFDNAAWTKLNATVTANNIAAPNGATTADKMTVTANGDGYVYVTARPFDGDITMSFYMKAGTSNTASLYLSGSNVSTALFTLTGSGTATVTAGSAYTTASIQALSNGWYRCSIRNLYATGGGGCGVVMLSALATDSVYLWGAQYQYSQNNSAIPGPYALTTASTFSSQYGVGEDYSGNANTWTPIGISLTPGTTYDAMTDVPTNTSATVGNYCTLNPVFGSTNVTLSEANLKAQVGSTGGVYRTAAGTFGVSSGKWYWELAFGNPTVGNPIVGVGDMTVATSSWNSDTSTNANFWYVDGFTGNKINGAAGTSYGSSFTTSDTCMVALDMDNGKIWWGKNGTWFASGNPASGTNAAFTNLANKLLTIALFGGCGSCGFTGNLYQLNFGQRPFFYTPPTGFKALNTYNIPDSTILKGNKYMDATLWTGTGDSNAQTIVNAGGFKPDLVWGKTRANVFSHALYDSVRGVGTSKMLLSNLTDAEGSVPTNANLTSFNSNGFTVGATSSTNILNYTPSTYVGWQWQAGQGTNTTNTSGSITSTISVNTTAGFSIVTYTGTGANATVGHGLGVAPKMVIVKWRSSVGSWIVWFNGFTASEYLILNNTDAKGTISNYWNGTPSSSVINLSSQAGINSNGGTYVAYCWAEIAGFSKFGSYTGNGSTDGPFVYTGFRPKFVMIKCSSSAQAGNASWYIQDSSRNTSNVANLLLYSDGAAAELTSTSMDLLSNGFKIRGSGVGNNASGSTYIYMAFAENPFKNSNAR